MDHNYVGFIKSKNEWSFDQAFCPGYFEKVEYYLNFNSTTTRLIIKLGV